MLAVAAVPVLASTASSPAPPLQATPAGVASPAGSGSFTPAPTPEPLPSSTYPPGSGARVFAENCAGCHGAKGEGYVGPPLAPAGFASLVAPMVTQGGINMPPFAGVLSDQDVNAVAEYVAQELADPAARTAEVSPGRRPLPSLLLRLPQRDRQRRRDGRGPQRAQHPPVPAGRGARRHDPRPRQHAGVRGQHVRRPPADGRRAATCRCSRRSRRPRGATVSAISGRSPRARPAASRSCCSSSSPSGSPGGPGRRSRERRRTGPRPAPAREDLAGRARDHRDHRRRDRLRVELRRRREQPVARRLAHARPARPRPRAGVLGPRPRRRRGPLRAVSGAAGRHRRPGGAGDAARRARLRDHPAELPQQVPDLRRRRVRAQPGRPARRARAVARRAACSPPAGARAAGS